MPLSYLLWKPVAVGLLFWGVLRYVRRLLPEGGPRHAALVLALFAVMPASALVAWTGLGGKPRQYTFDFIAGELQLGPVPVGLPDDRDRGRADAARAARGRGLAAHAAHAHARARRRSAACSSAGCSRGRAATLVLVLLAAEALTLAARARAPAGGAARGARSRRAVPAIYYALLERTDAAWELAGQVNAAGTQITWSWPWWAVVLTLAPLALPAALAYRRPARSWQELALRVWPLAALAVYLAPVGTFPYHAFQGMTIPLAVLAVQGVAVGLAAPAARRRRRRSSR